MAPQKERPPKNTLIRKKKSENSQSPSFSAFPNLRRQFFRKRGEIKNGGAYSDFGPCAEKGIRMGAMRRERSVADKDVSNPPTPSTLFFPPLSLHIVFLTKYLLLLLISHPPTSLPLFPYPLWRRSHPPSSRFASFLFRLGKGLSKSLPGGKICGVGKSSNLIKLLCLPQNRKGGVFAIKQWIV